MAWSPRYLYRTLVNGRCLLFSLNALLTSNLSAAFHLHCEHIPGRWVYCMFQRKKEKKRKPWL